MFGLSSYTSPFLLSFQPYQGQEGGWEGGWHLQLMRGGPARHCPLEPTPHFQFPGRVLPSVQGVFTRVGQEMDVNLAEEAIIQNFPINPRGPGATLGPWRSLLLSV